MQALSAWPSPNPADTFRCTRLSGDLGRVRGGSPVVDGVVAGVAGWQTTIASGIYPVRPWFRASLPGGSQPDPCLGWEEDQVRALIMGMSPGTRTANP